MIDAAVWAAGVVAALASLVADHCEPLDASLSPVSVTCLFAVAIGLVACVRRVTKFRAAFLAASLLAAFVAMTSANQRTVPTGLVVSFLDVGQGDAAVVEFPTGEVWLVDAGGRPFSRDPEAVSSPGLRSVVPFLRHRRIRRIDAVVLSHAHPDHYAGLAAIATRMPIGTVFVATDDIDQPRPRSLRLLLSQLEFLGTEVTDPPVYMSIGDARAAFLAPTYLGRVGVDPVSGVNDNSIAMRIEYGGRSILFAGDLEGEGEDLLVEAKRDQLDVDIAKVNHHGSKTSSSAEWVDATSARYAVISCGRGNRFGFPDSGVLARWRESGARVLRTDLSGTITFRIDRAGDIGVETFVALPR